MEQQNLYRNRDLESLSVIELYSHFGSGLFRRCGNSRTGGGGSGGSSAYLNHKNLEDISAAEFYTGNLGGFGGFGVGGGGHGNIGGFGSLRGGSAPLRLGGSKPLDFRKTFKQTNLSDYGIGKASKPLYIKGGGGGFKIFGEGNNLPLTRIDLNKHEFGAIHLQHGENDYFGRKGNEAGDIFGQIYKLNPKIKFPWEDK